MHRPLTDTQRDSLHTIWTLCRANGGSTRLDDLADKARSLVARGLVRRLSGTGLARGPRRRFQARWTICGPLALLGLADFCGFVNPDGLSVWLLAGGLFLGANEDLIRAVPWREVPGYVFLCTVVLPVALYAGCHVTPLWTVGMVAGVTGTVLFYQSA